jgi:hypothetical protein
VVASLRSERASVCQIAICKLPESTRLRRYLRKLNAIHLPSLSFVLHTQQTLASCTSCDTESPIFEIFFAAFEAAEKNERSRHLQRSRPFRSASARYIKYLARSLTSNDYYPPTIPTPHRIFTPRYTHWQLPTRAVRDGWERRRPAQAGYTSNDVKVRRQKESLAALSSHRRARAASRDTQVVISQRRSFQQDEGTRFCTDPPLCTACAHLRPLSGGLFMMMSLAHASTSKLTRGLINAAIGSCWAHPDRAEHRTRRFSANWSPKERIF